MIGADRSVSEAQESEGIGVYRRESEWIGGRSGGSLEIVGQLLEINWATID